MGIRNCIVNQDISVVIQYFRVKCRLCIFAAVGDRRVCRSHLQVVYAAGNASEGGGLGNIGISLIVRIRTVDKRCKAEFFKVFISFFKPYCFSERPYRADIHGVKDGIAGGCPSDIYAVPVPHRFAARVIVRLVVNQCGKSHSAFIESGSVSRYDLERRTGLLGRICGAIQRTAGLLLPASADNSFDLSRVLIHDYNGSLRLQGDFDLFIHRIAGFRVNIQRALIFFHGCARFVLRAEYERILVIVRFFNVCSKLFFAVVLGCAVGAVDGKGVLDAVFGHCKIIAHIRNLLVADLLNSGVLG